MLKIGILFGGPSREREISFAGGRTVYDNLNKSLFEPIPIFIDSHRNFILLDWQYVYKGTIRDFYPPIQHLPASPNEFQIYMESLGKLSNEDLNKIIRKVGRKIELSELSSLIDVAFLALHGIYGEDGQLQGLLDGLNIPYTGSGVRGCAIGMDKAFQKNILSAAGFPSPKVIVVPRKKLKDTNLQKLYQEAKQSIGFPMVIRPANQGSSIGVAIINDDKGVNAFADKINAAFFISEITFEKWSKHSNSEKIETIRAQTDIRDGLGFPMDVNGKTIYHPEALLSFLNTHFGTSNASVQLESHLSEQIVIIESFIHGKEFSCIVIKDEDGKSISLPPTEIVKGNEVFDYRSKYLPGLSRKITPIDVPNKNINAIRQECEKLFDFLGFNTYARIDGFITKDNEIYLNDPNTTSGMLPSSFFFHQAAEIGLNPSQFLTYIIRTSIQERIESNPDKTGFEKLLSQLDHSISGLKNEVTQKKKIAVILGGYSFERHISVESGRNIFEKLASSDKYEPTPIFLTGNQEHHELYQIPINLLLKDNADDIRDKILNFKKHTIIDDIKLLCKSITDKYASSDVIFEPKKVSYTELAEMVDGAFIALHGRPGEDGTVQKKLAGLGIAYNGSNFESSNITIDKYQTLQILKKNGFIVTNQQLVYKNEFLKNSKQQVEAIEKSFSYPFIAKPVDDGCSSAVKKIDDRAELIAFMEAIFRDQDEIPTSLQQQLELKPKEEFPQKKQVLIEALITANGANRFMEITGGLLTHYEGDKISFEMFEPSEALAGGEILSLEEKFLAGEGQNITPARYSKNADEYTYIATQVKEDLHKAAKVLNIRGYARIDAFVRIFDNNRAETIIIEINSLPGMTPATCIFHQCAINGYKPYEFIDKILEFGFTRQKLQSNVKA